MQDGFLFDDNDPRQRGKGVDRKGTKKDGLKLKWSWTRVCERSWFPGSKELKDNRRTPGQVCFAEYGDFLCKVIFWHTHYEARIEHCGELLLYHDKDTGDSKKGEVLVTRLQAQLKAEQLLVDFYKELESVLVKNDLILKGK